MKEQGPKRDVRKNNRIREKRREEDELQRYRERKDRLFVTLELEAYLNCCQDSQSATPSSEELSVVQIAWAENSERLRCTSERIATQFWCRCWVNDAIEVAANALDRCGFRSDEIRSIQFDHRTNSWNIQNKWSKVIDHYNGSHPFGDLHDDRYWKRDFLFDEHLRYVQRILQSTPLVTESDLRLDSDQSYEAFDTVSSSQDWGGYLRAIQCDYGMLCQYEPKLRERIIDLVLARLDFPLAALFYVAMFAMYWRRSCKQFKGESYLELIDHQFVVYPPPLCLYSAWSSLDYDSRNSWGKQLKAISWFLVCAQGMSLSVAGKELTWRIPSRLQHFLTKVPTGMSFTASIIFAEVLRLGGRDTDVRRILEDPSYVIDFTEPQYEEQFLKFWRDTIAWLIKHREAISDEQSASILAWAQHCYTEGNLGRQVAFSWKRRLPAAAIQASEAYYQEMHRTYINPSIHLVWSNHGWDWKHTDGNGFVWKFCELTSGIALFQEGQAMSHCVGSYASPCANGRCAIFSLRCNDERTTTIELDLNSKQVVQAQGRFNQMTTSATYEIIELWQKCIVEAAEDKQPE